VYVSRISTADSSCTSICCLISTSSFCR
jgi:hypothetical protein